MLVTGATGFLGSHLCARLMALGHESTAFRRRTSPTDRIASPAVRCISGELTDLEALRNAVASHDVVIHAAADIRSWPPEPDLQTRANVEGSRNVARACRQEGVRRMIHVSSVSALGIPENPLRPADEDFHFDLRGPGFNYHLSKKLAEDAILEEVAGGLDAVIVNPGSLFGPYGSAYRGSEMIGKAARGKLVPCFSGGRCAVHVDDVVDGILAAVEKGIRGNRYILGGENVSYRQIAMRSANALHLHPVLPTVPSWCVEMLKSVAIPIGQLRRRTPPFAAHFFDNRWQYYSSEKARSALGYAPRGFDQIIDEWVVWRRGKATAGKADEL
ncbi:MAG TPA: NAD-dependent epimerase/dehydratase family protein [Bryobacteraceae bacterium]